MGRVQTQSYICICVCNMFACEHFQQWGAVQYILHSINILYTIVITSSLLRNIGS